MVNSPDRAVGTPAKKAAEREGPVGVMPLAIRTLCTMHQSNDFTLGGRQFRNVVLVGTLEHSKVMNANAEYTLNDGTGTLLLKDFADEREGREAFTEGKTVRVCGEARPSAAEFYLSVKSMSEVKSQIEVGHHRLEVCKALCLFERGSSDTVEMSTPVKAPPPVKVELEAKAPSPLSEQKIVELVTEMSVEELGVTVAAVCQRLASPEAEVRAAVQKLLDSGTIYTTIDEEHIAIC